MFERAVSGAVIGSLLGINGLSMGAGRFSRLPAKCFVFPRAFDSFSFHLDSLRDGEFSFSFLLFVKIRKDKSLYR